MDSIEKALKDYEERIAKTIHDDAEKHLAECNKVLQSSVNTLVTAQQQYITKLGELDVSLKKREEIICTKIDSTLYRLDRLDFEDIRNECNRIRKSLNVKFAIVLSGIVCTLVFAILSFL